MFDGKLLLLCITETADSTGLIEARAVEAALNDWGCAEKIVAMGFDTTASNTGVHRGACTFLQLQLQRQLLWLACRHHIAELILRSAFDSLFGDTTAPKSSSSRFCGRPGTHSTFKTSSSPTESQRCTEEESILY